MSWEQTFKAQKKAAANVPPHGKGPGKGKGQRGFQFVSPRSSAFRTKHARTIVIASVLLAVTGMTVLLFTGGNATPDFLILVLSLTVLCALVGYDTISRRKWENALTGQINKLARNHDRLVREVARNRNDIAFVKDGLGKAAEAVEAQGRRMSPSSSAEARLIRTIADRLGELGDRPRSDIETPDDRHILKLELAPPPRTPLPPLKNEDKAAPDYSKFSDTVILELLQYAIRNDKIDVFAQPVVRLPQRKPDMYEVYARLRAGGGVYIPAARYLKVAREENLVPAIDNLLLLRCLQTLRSKTGKASETPFILNISGTTLSDGGFMGDLVSFLAAHRAMARRLVFELAQGELLSIDKAIIPILEGLSQLGCRFSVDHLRSKQLDIGLLKGRYTRFIKIDARWLLREGGDRQGYARILRLKKALDSVGIDLIAERIEQEKQLRELLDFNIDFGQGTLFGKPDLLAAYTSEKQEAA